MSSEITQVNLWTALVTPFTSSGALDHKAFECLISRQVEAGVRGLLLFGSTGEAATLEGSEKADLVARLLKLKGEASLMVGITHNNTQVLIERAKEAAQWGADALLVAPPYYNKPTPEGVFEHYAALHEATSLPIVLYNIPGRVGVSLSFETIKKLASLPRVVGLKEASGDLLLATRSVQEGLTVWSGDDPLILPYMSVGAMGGISVSGNLFPAEFLKMIDSFHANEVIQAREIAFQFSSLFPLLFAESNPLGIKAAMAHRGLLANCFRLPLTPMTTQNATRLYKALDSLEVSLI